MPEHLPGLPHWKRDGINRGARRDDGLVLVLDPWTDDGRGAPGWRLHSYDGPYRGKILAEEKNPNRGIVVTYLISGRSITEIARLVDESYPFDAVVGAKHRLRVAIDAEHAFTEEYEAAEAAYEAAVETMNRLRKERAAALADLERLKRARETAS